MIELKVFRKRRIALLKRMMIVLAILTAVTLALVIIFTCLGTTLKVEAGEDVDLCDIFNHNDVDFDVDFDKENLNHPGTYECTILVGNKPRKAKIIVTDTQAPKIKVHNNVYIAGVDTIPTPEDFVAEGYDPDGYIGEFLTNMSYNFQIGKSYTITVRYKDPSGNKTQKFDVIASFIEDKTTPQINIADTITFTTDDAISYKSILNVTDNCIGNVTVNLDDTGVDYKTPGEYSVKITATDISGNKSEKTVSVVIVAGKSFNPDLAKLNEKIETIIPTIITSDMTKEEKCRQIYTFVQKSITYAPTSKSHDYVEVAYDALFVSGEGDCFAYFAAAKALLDYVGIENMDIERSEDNVEGTHFWNYVNIGTKENPQWYHFDCTELAQDYRESGCLLTNTQVKAYDDWRYDSLGTNFRQYDKTKYPKASTQIITETPNLKDYMD